MYYQEYKPSAHLAEYIQCYWILRAESNPFPAPERLIPDGTIELIFNFGSPYIRHNEIDQDQQALIKGSHLVGERTHYYLIEQLGTIDHVAIRFKAGGLYPFVAMPISELTGYVPQVELILGQQSKIIESKLFEANNDKGRIEILENFLMNRLTQLDKVDPFIYNAIRQLTQSREKTSIKAVAEYLGYSERQLERKFLAMVGVSPKFYSRVVQFMAVFDQVKQNGHHSWGSLAMACGYYDQAHFIKVFKAFTGLTPAKFFTERRYIAEMLTATDAMSDFYNTNVLKSPKIKAR